MICCASAPAGVCAMRCRADRATGGRAMGNRQATPAANRADNTARSALKRARRVQPACSRRLDGRATSRFRPVPSYENSDDCVVLSKPACRRAIRRARAFGIGVFEFTPGVCRRDVRESRRRCSLDMRRARFAGMVKARISRRGRNGSLRRAGRRAQRRMTCAVRMSIRSCSAAGMPRARVPARRGSPATNRALTARAASRDGRCPTLRNSCRTACRARGRD